MLRKVLLSLIVLAAGVVSTVQVQASKGLSPGDQIVRDYSRATGFRQWTEMLTRHSVPGDFQYLQQAYKAYPDLIKNDTLPKLNFEKDTFKVRDGLSEVSLQYFSGQPYTYAINGQKVEFSRYDLPSQKMKKILGAMKKNAQASSFVLLPLAWAQDSHIPTKTSVSLLSIISATISLLLPPTAPTLSDLMDKVKDTPAWKNLSRNVTCMQKINEVEDVIHAQEQLDFSGMECSAMGLRIQLVADKEHSYSKDLVIEKDGFYIEETQPNHTTVSSHYKLTQPDARFKSASDPTALTSSPAQRDQMGGQFEPMGGASQELMESYMGVAAPSVRNFCATDCSETLKTYWKLLQSATAGNAPGSSQKGTH